MADARTKGGSFIKNIILIGMPGSGKSTLARLLGARLGRDDFDCDEYVRAAAGMSVADVWAREGEDGFRLRETQALSALCAGQGRIIATGGGCVTREENYPLLHQNSTVFWIRRDPRLLPLGRRLLPDEEAAKRLYELRRPLYERFADVAVDNNGSAEECAKKLLSLLNDAENKAESR